MNGKNHSVSKYALGSVKMISHAIHDHLAAHNDKFPRQIELHPAALQGFLRELLRDYPLYYQDYSFRGTFLSIPIIENRHAGQPMLVNHEGDIEYL